MFQSLFDRKDVRPGCVIALQTFGAYAGNWHPHAHAIVSDGAFTPEGEFLPLPRLDTTVVLEVFRRLWLRRLHQAERLSEAFMNNLLSWVHPGFTVFAGPPVAAGNLESLESQARYIARPAMAMDALEQRRDGTFAMETPRNPRSGATLVVLDALEWIHRITAHIPIRDSIPGARMAPTATVPGLPLQRRKTNPGAQPKPALPARTPTLPAKPGAAGHAY
jgi:hypothetical protein